MTSQTFSLNSYEFIIIHFPSGKKKTVILDSPADLGKGGREDWLRPIPGISRQLLEIKIMTANGYTCLMFQLLVKLMLCLILMEVMYLSGDVNLLPFHYIRCKNSSP